ncbi:MAG: VCBS repeat-containing protein [Myxococcales bacterium]|nr:VCBS repeat-containing protein [Myxococcales bacterium]
MTHRSLRVPLTVLALVAMTTSPAQAADPPQTWLQVPSGVFLDPLPGYWTTKVEIADVNDDGWPDILFANVGGYQAGTPDSFQSNQCWINDGGMSFADSSVEVFGEDVNNPGKASQDTARVIKAHDLDKDGDTDIIVGTTWASTSRLYLQDAGAFTEMSDLLPQTKLSAGDLELGDVDGDGDVDVVISDWGQAPVGFLNSPGGVTRLWLNDGNATFTDATNQKMPAIPVNWSWDHEFIDIDNDWDLDLVISCRSCQNGSYLFVNDGSGKFTNATMNFPQKFGTVDMEVMDLDDDGYADLVSLQDGDGFRNRVLINNQNGGFDDKTPLWWAPADNPPSFDYMAAFADFDSDGLADLVLGAFGDYKDRLMRNQGSGFKQVTSPSMMGNLVTDGTYAIAVSDLNGDRKIDLVMGEGENSFRNRVLFGEDIAEDTAKPHIGAHEFDGSIEPGGVFTFHGRIHDSKTPNKPHDWSFVGVQWVTDDGSFDNPDDITSFDLEWYGEHLWRTPVEDGAELVLPTFDSKISIRVCAIDAALNESCVELVVDWFLCGDGKVNSKLEECDDGNDIDGDGCESTCQLTDFCGNGVVDPGEDCDDGNDVDGDGCDNDCTFTSVCGNGVVEPGEACDDGNVIDGDGCESNCTTTPSETTGSSATDSDSETATDSDSESASATDTMATTDSETATDSATTGWAGQLDDDGCGCSTENPRGAGTGLLLFGLLALRRRRR